MIVTSAAVPAVVGTAMMGMEGCFVGATPSRLRTSANSGLAMMIPTAFEVSIDEPPPMATMQSAPDALNASTPALTFSMVGFGWMSLKTEYAMPSLSSRPVTLAVTPNFTRSGSEATKAFFSPRHLISPGMAVIAPAP